MYFHCADAIMWKCNCNKLQKAFCTTMNSVTSAMMKKILSIAITYVDRTPFCSIWGCIACDCYWIPLFNYIEWLYCEVLWILVAVTNTLIKITERFKYICVLEVTLNRVRSQLFYNCMWILYPCSKIENVLETNHLLYNDSQCSTAFSLNFPE